MATDTAPPRRTTYREVLAIGQFRVLFAGQLLLVAGMSLQVLALSVLVYAQTGSAFYAAVAFGAGFWPQLLGGSTLTALADRVPPRPLLVADPLLQAAVATALALAPLPIAGKIALVATHACLEPVFAATRGGLLPSVLPEDTYVLGRSLFTVSSSVAQLGGLAFGGVLLASTSPTTLLLGAASCHLVASVVARLGLADHPRRAVATGHGVLAATWRGNRALLADRQVRSLLVLQWVPVSLVTGAESLVVAYVGESGGPAGATGWLLAALPVGMLVGDVAVGRLCRPDRRERLVLPLLLLLGTPLLGLAWGPPLLVTGLLLGLAAPGVAYVLALQRAFVDAVPEHMRGQAFGLLSTGLMSGQGLAPVVCGAAAGPLGAGPAMAAAGGAILLTALLLRARPNRRVTPAARSGHRTQRRDA